MSHPGMHEAFAALQDANRELLETARAVLREHRGGAFTIAERRLAETLVRVTGKPWPECLGEPAAWEIPEPLRLHGLDWRGDE